MGLATEGYHAAPAGYDTLAGNDTPAGYDTLAGNDTSAGYATLASNDTSAGYGSSHHSLSRHFPTQQWVDVKFIDVFFYIFQIAFWLKH